MESDAKVWPLLPYQARWVDDRSTVKVAVKSRRVGLSWAEAYDSVLHAASGGGNISYISYSKDMTVGFISDCADWARRLHGALLTVNEAKLEDEALLEDDGREILSYSITFSSGKKIEALSSAPRQLRSRGRPGDRVIIDEAAFVDRIDDLLQSAMAVTIWGGSIRIISTHNGALNAFNSLTEDIRVGNLNYSLHQITFRDAIADGLYKRILEVRRQAAMEDQSADAEAHRWSDAGEDAWTAARYAAYRYPWQAAEELDCVPADGAGAWISAEDYAAAEHAAAGLPAEYSGGGCFIGYDVARRRDLAVLSVIEKSGSALWLREMIIMRDQRFSDQLAALDALVRIYNPRRIVIDQTGMGEAIVEQVQDRHGRSRVAGEVLSANRRLEIATALRTAFEDRQIRIPRDNALRQDIRSMRRAPGVTSDRPRLISDGADTDGHADRFWSIALAVCGANGGAMVFEFHRVRPHEPHHGQVRARASGIRYAPGAL